MKLRLTDKRKIKPRPKSNEASMEPVRKFCVCQSTEDKGFMIWCEVCFDWFHGACVNLTPVEAKGMAHYTCPQCITKTEDIRQEGGVPENSDSQPTKKENRKRTIKAKSKAAPRTNSSQPNVDHDATNPTSLPQPPLKRRRALPNITTASPLKQNLSNNTSPVQQHPIRARAKIMVIPQTTENHARSALSMARSLDTSSPLLSPAEVPSNGLHEQQKEPRQPSHIGMLNDDCLLFICKIVGEQSINNLLTFMGVCRRWRMVALSPSAWDAVGVDFRKFCSQVYAVMASQQIMHQFSYIRKFRFSEDRHSNHGLWSFKFRTMSWMFPKVREASFDGMLVEHIFSFISAFRDLEVISCTRMEKPPYFEMNLLSFADHTHLRKLHLHFQNPCEHSSYGYLMKKRGQWLPSSLETLSIINVYDTEEHDITGSDWWNVRTDSDFNRLVARWNLMEDALVSKYAFFSGMPHLRNLTVGRCNSWTSRVWMECFLPCCERLEHLHLIGWDGDGCRESPTSWRQRVADEGNNTVGDSNDDAEQAIVHCISQMKNLRSLCLEDFNVPNGLIDLVHTLPRMESCSVL